MKQIKRRIPLTVHEEVWITEWMVKHASRFTDEGELIDAAVAAYEEAGYPFRDYTGSKGWQLWDIVCEYTCI